MTIISMNKTANLLYVCVMILRCIWHFHYVYAKQQIPVSLNYKGLPVLSTRKYTSDIKNFEIVFPQRVTKDGNFISNLVHHHHSKRSTNEIQYIFYKIPIGGKDYLIELTPNRKLIAPGAVVEIRKEDVRKSSKREFFNENNPNETLRKMFENLEIKKLKNTECHFTGHVKGENISKAALSTCYGLAGFIQIKQGFYLIEPVAGHDPFLKNSYPHILYEEDGLENSSTCHTIREMAKSLLDKVIRKRRESYIGLSAPMFAETLIVMDKTMINHHRDSDCENYVLTVFNMAFNLFRDVSLGMLMTLTVVRIIRLEIEDDEFKFQMNLKLNENAENTLRYFQTWQYEINPGDDTHPNHHDIALLLTRVNVCYSPTSCGILGLTTIGKACDPKQSAALCEDSGLRLGYVIAHEIGHLLGAGHDTTNSTCSGTSKNGLRTVMHPHVSLASKIWSKRSQAYFKEFFKTAENCFLDEPEEHQFNEQDLLPGVMYNANFQCKYLFTLNSRECEIGSTCNSLNCHIPGYACIVTHTPPADGTRCGESMWCHNSKCLVVGERPGAIDGNWGEWSAWSECTRTCGSGVASSIRNCDRPQPAHGGKNCAGERKRYKICAATITIVPQNISDLIRLISEEVNVSFVGKPCETGRPSFRDIQCGEFNDWIYPEDGKIHSWKAYYFHEDNPCVLYCINERKMIAALRPRVIDGTMCYRGFRDLCIAGTCKSLPCDLHFGSNAIEDACGVCHGDGTGCEFSQGVQTLPELKKGLTKLVNIPAGTKNIKVEEMSPTLSRIVVRDKDTKDIYVRGKNLGIFNVPGSQAWLGMIKKNQEALRIPGPVSKPLSVWIQRLENVTVKWSMALPAEQQRKPEFVWDFLKWGPCSAECGPGTQKSDPSCVEEKAGLVEDSFCADLQMPAAKVRPCEIAKCIPRWMVGDWKNCDQSKSQKKEKKRAVYCIKKFGEGEGETQIVPDSECKDPKPHSVEPCENRRKREDTGYNYLTEESVFKSDTSEYAFHKKYDNYLKHFAVISVPQKKSETIPFHLVSSPHFRHYFHVLETPEDSDTDSMEIDDLNENSIDNITDRIQNKVSSDFYKNTFSGHRNDVSHLINKLSVKKRKGVFFENPKGIKKRTKKVADETILKRLTKKEHTLQKRNRPRNIKRRSNLSYITKFLVPKKKLFLSHKIFHGREFSGSRKTYLKSSQFKRNAFPEFKTTWHKTQLKKLRKLSAKNAIWRYNSYLPHTARQRLMKREFFLQDFNTNNQRLKDRDKRKLRKFSFLKPSLIWKSSQEGDRSLSLGKERKKDDKRGHKNFLPNLFNSNFVRPTIFGEGERYENLFFAEKNAKIYFEKTPHPILTYRKLSKTKRSNWKRKKLKLKDTSSKSIKDCSDNSGNTETRNYLNNLFRENRKRVTTRKPPILLCPVEEPVIQAGKIVIDRDSVEDKHMEILFLDEDNEERIEKSNQLPRPPVNEKKLSLKGQEVFDLIQKLQRRSCLYRQGNETDEKPKTEVDVRIPANSSDDKTQTTIQNTERETYTVSKSENATTTPTSANENEGTTPMIKQHQANETAGTTPMVKQHQANETAGTTKLHRTTTEETNPTTKPVCASQNGTNEEISIETSDGDEHYDIDEIIPYPPGAEQTTTEEAKKKKKKKVKKKKYKGPLLEDYEHEIDEKEAQNMTNKKPTSRYYDWKELIKRKKRHSK